jgi:hypothetical protein
LSTMNDSSRPSAAPSPTKADAPARRKADYWSYYYDQCRKLAPRTIDWDSHAFEAVLALLMLDYPEKTESQCVIALANMQLYAPLTGPRSGR